MKMNNFKDFRQSFIGKFYESLLSGVDRSKDLIQEMVGVQKKIERFFSTIRNFVYTGVIGVTTVFVKASEAVYAHVAYFKDLFVDYGRKTIDAFSFGNSNIADIVWVIYVLIVSLVMLTFFYYFIRLLIKLIKAVRLVLIELTSMKNEILLLVTTNVEVKKPIDVLGAKGKNVNGEEVTNRRYSDAEHIAHLRRK